MNRLRRLLQKIVPAARGFVSWRHAIPLVLFLILFALVCFSVVPVPRVYLSDEPLSVFGMDGIRIPGMGTFPTPHVELIQELEFDFPWMFLLLLITPWIWWMQTAGHSGLPSGRAAFAAFTRLVITGLLIIVLAGPRAVHTSDVVSVMYTVDVSDSVNEARSDCAVSGCSVGRDETIQRRSRTGYLRTHSGRGTASPGIVSLRRIP